jgi:hypothetical protein
MTGSSIFCMLVTSHTLCVHKESNKYYVHEYVLVTR